MLLKTAPKANVWLRTKTEGVVTESRDGNLQKRNKPRRIYTAEEIKVPKIAEAYELELARNQSRGF